MSDPAPRAHPGFGLRGVSVRREQRTVLTGIDLELTEHRIGVIGLNGSGKSTLVRLLNGLLLPTTGTVTWNGLDTRREAKRVRRAVGFVFQNPDNQIVMPLVGEDVAFGVRNLGLPRAEVPVRVRAALDRFGLGDLHDREAHTLSGGEKQLLALAGVLIMEPEVVVFDEPTTLLDLRNVRRLGAEIAALGQQVIMVSHDLDALAGFDRVLRVEDGRVVDDGPADAVITGYRRRWG